MFIVFEGPDKTGKSTSAQELDAGNSPTYNLTKTQYQEDVAYRASQSPSELMIPSAYDRIDWLTHLVYRLAMPKGEWNDVRERTVFAMPEAHLVLKMHEPGSVASISDELYEAGKLGPVNEMYYHYIMFLSDMNRRRGYDLFKSVSIVQVENQPNGVFKQHLAYHDNPVFNDTYQQVIARAVTTNTDLLEFLHEQDQRLG